MDIVWSQSDYAEWADGQRRFTGPGVVSLNDGGQVTACNPLPAPTVQDVSAVAQEVPQVPDAEQPAVQVEASPEQEAPAPPPVSNGG